jgi:hypothetical protein
MGEETNQYMRAANKDLRDQRDVLITVQEKNQQINKDLDAGGAVVKRMTRREFYYRIAIFTTIILLFLAIVFVLIMKIVGIFK